MQVTGKEVAEKFIDYLNHRLLLSELVDWAEEVMREWGLEERARGDQGRSSSDEGLKENGTGEV